MMLESPRCEKNDRFRGFKQLREETKDELDKPESHACDKAGVAKVRKRLKRRQRYPQTLDGVSTAKESSLSEVWWCR